MKKLTTILERGKLLFSSVMSLAIASQVLANEPHPDGLMQHEEPITSNPDLDQISELTELSIDLEIYRDQVFSETRADLTQD
jgi:hypothetical protein